MAYDRRKTADVLFFALQCAKNDRIAFSECFDDKNCKEAQDAKADIRAIERLQKMIFGDVRNALDSDISKMNRRAGIEELKQLLTDHPNLFQGPGDVGEVG